MAVRIRLSRVGATKRPSYRVVAIDSRRPRDGRALEILGFYDPLTKPATVRIDAERFAVWVGKGALPSATVAKLIKINAAPAPAEAPSAKTPAAKTPAAKTPAAKTPAAKGAAPKPARPRKPAAATAKAAE